jgi:conjugative transfer signal peptidase TraF
LRLQKLLKAVTVKRAVIVCLCWTVLAAPFIWRENMPQLFVRNITASVPLGFYLILPLSALEKGDYVSFAPPEEALNLALERQWAKQPSNFLKTIGAMPGDFYTLTDEAIYINGRYVGPVYNSDSHGRPMPKIRGTFVVQEGHFLPIATYRTRSYDGRYYGQVPLAAIRYKVYPVLIDKLWGR